MGLVVWDNSAQGSDGWLKARQGHLTASRMADAIAFGVKGKELEARKQLKLDIIAERMTGLTTTTFITDAMKWGTEKEPEARSLYETLTGSTVQQCGFAQHPTIPFFGASPDGLLMDDRGVVEIKCPTSRKHLAWMLEGEVPFEHRPQILAQLACTGREYCDFISYDPRFPEPSNRFIRRYTPSPEDIISIEEAAKTFLAEVEELWDRLTMTL